MRTERGIAGRLYLPPRTLISLDLTFAGFRAAIYFVMFFPAQYGGILALS